MGGEKARPAAWEEGSWGAEGGDGEPSWTMVAPRFGGRYGGGGLFWGRDLPYWGGGEEERARGEGASPHVISLEAQVSPARDGRLTTPLSHNKSSQNSKRSVDFRREYNSILSLHVRIFVTADMGLDFKLRL